MSEAKSLEIALVSGRSPKQIQTAILERLAARLREQVDHVYTKNGRPSKRAIEEQAAFLAGAITAMHAVFGEDDKLSPQVCPPSWFWKTLGGDLVVDLKGGK